MFPSGNDSTEQNELVEIDRQRAQGSFGSRQNHQLPRIVLSNSSSSSSVNAKLIRSYFLLALTHKYLILAVTILVLFFAGIRALIATPMYRADATVRIGTYTPAMHGIAREDYVAQQTRELDYLNTQVELLTSLGVADAVLAGNDDFKAVFDSYLSRYQDRSFLKRIKQLLLGKPERIIDPSDTSYRFNYEELQDYLSLISIRPVRRTSLVKIQALTASPELSARIANLHSEHYIQYVRAEREKGALENLVFLKNQAAELADKVSESERKLASYAEANSIVAVTKDENIVVNRLSELSRLVTEASAKRVKSESAWREATGGSGVGGLQATDQAMQQMLVNLRAAESELASLSEKFKPTYPRILELQAKVKNLKKSFDTRRADISKELEADYRADLKSEEALKEQLEMQKSQTFELSKREVQYNILKREFESLKDLHQSVLRQLKEAQLSSEQQSSNISLVERAAIPLEHVTPRRALTMLLALIGGPILGFLLALLITALDNTVKTGEEVSALVDLPVLGVVPDFEQSRRLSLPQEQNSNSPLIELTAVVDSAQDKLVPAGVRPKRSQDSLISVVAPNSISSEVFRTIRTSILLSAAEESRPRVILLTSAKKSEGKTVLSTNLAVTLAQAGYRVVLLDCDLRRPAVYRYFSGDSISPGLVDVIIGNKTIDQVLLPSAIERLSVITTGQSPPNPAELIGSEKMRSILKELSGRYDYVLLDSPPVLPVTDSAILSRMVDGVILVTRAENTPRPLIRDAANRLRQVGARMLGVVVNGANTEGGNYYYYRHAYSYYYDDDLPTFREAMRGMVKGLKSGNG